MVQSDALVIDCSVGGCLMIRGKITTNYSYRRAHAHSHSLDQGDRRVPSRCPFTGVAFPAPNPCGWPRRALIRRKQRVISRYFPSHPVLLRSLCSEGGGAIERRPRVPSSLRRLVNPHRPP